VTQGDIFGFRMYTVDNSFGAATNTFNVFSFSTGAITVTPASPSICAGTTLALTASGGGSSYAWTGGITNSVPFTPTASVVYTVTSQGGCTSTKTVPVTVYPGLSISPANPTICVGTPLQLSASGGTAYSWSTGPSTNTINVAPASNVSYSVTGTTTAGCNSSASVNVLVVQGNPSLTVVNSATANGVCPGKSTTLTASGAVSYAWSGGISNGVAFFPTSTQSYTVTGTNACGTGTAAISVSIHPSPTVTAAASTSSLCSGSTATLIGGGAVSYVWSNGVPNATSFAPSVTSNYTVVGTSALNCTAQAITGITVVTTPSLAPVVTPTRICVGSSATISVTGATNYSWSTGATTSSIGISPTNTTTYSITKWNANCFDTKTATVLVDPLPTVFAIASSTIVCSLQTVTLNAGGGASYTWSPYGGNSSQAFVSPATTTTFTVAAFDGSCTSSTSIQINTNPNPVVNIAASSSVICAGQTVSMTVSGTDTYSWTNPSSLGTATFITDNPMGPTNYQVVGTNTTTGCSSPAAQVVLVNAVPILTVAATKTLVCINGPSTLTVKGNGVYTYSWSSGPTTTATIVNPQNTTVYSVTGTNPQTTCKSTSLVTVSVFQPSFSVNSPTSSCLGGTITLIASGANTYTWNGTTPFPSIQVSPTTPTFYVVAASSTLNNVKCESTNTVFVTIYANPTITAAPHRTIICSGESTSLTASGGLTYTWSTLQTGNDVPVSPNVQTTYSVVGVDQNGCKGTATVQVKLSPCTGISEVDQVRLSVYPNPNNGEFVVESPTDVNLSLINELGQQVMTLRLSAANSRKVNLTGLANGIYFITGNNGSQTINQKIIVTR
jgi:hypothetical protein